MLRRLTPGGWLAALMLACAAQAAPAGRAKHFILVVWDGMRPDFVSEELTPNLYALRNEGVWFAHHHSAYPTSTEVNGTVLATGVFPRRSGIVANREYRREIDPLNSFGTEAIRSVRRGDAAMAGQYIALPTLAERVQVLGFTTAVAGAKGVALLHDRRERDESSPAKVWFGGACLPEALLPALTNRLGAFPAAVAPNTGRDDWTYRCLIDVFWEREVSRYSVLWLSEPDYSQHNAGVNAPKALAAIRNCDRLLGELRQALERLNAWQDTDLMMASDHGFSTIGANAETMETLRKAGLNARTKWEKPPVDGDVMIVGNGGSVMIYIIGHAPEIVRKAVAALQSQPATGVIFTGAGLPGTFALSEAMIDAPTAPDIVVGNHWTLSQDGPHPKSVLALDGYSEYRTGQGMHVTLSPTDLHNTGFACGPDFRRGVVDPLPSGNVDIAPTLLWLMGIEPHEKLDGRVLTEALVGEGPPLQSVQLGRRDARVELPGGVWEQYLRFTELNGVRYLDEGNGKWTAK